MADTIINDFDGTFKTEGSVGMEEARDFLVGREGLDNTSFEGSNAGSISLKKLYDASNTGGITLAGNAAFPTDKYSLGGLRGASYQNNTAPTISLLGPHVFFVDNTIRTPPNPVSNQWATIHEKWEGTISEWSCYIFTSDTEVTLQIAGSIDFGVGYGEWEIQYYGQYIVSEDGIAYMSDWTGPHNVVNVGGTFRPAAPTFIFSLKIADDAGTLLTTTKGDQWSSGQDKIWADTDFKKGLGISSWRNRYG